MAFNPISIIHSYYGSQSYETFITTDIVWKNTCDGAML